MELPTNFHKLMGLIGGIIAFLGFMPYITTMVKGTSKPSRASWAVWSVMGLVILGTYYASGARNNLPVTIALAVGPIVTFLFTLKYGEGGDNTFDKTCLIGALGSLALWKGLNSPVLGLCGALITDFIGVLPTWRNFLKKGDQEEWPAWVIWSVGNICNMFTIEKLTVQDALYPTYYLVGTGVSTFLVLRGHYRKKTNNARKEV